MGHEVVYGCDAAAAGRGPDRVVLLLRFWHPDLPPRQWRQVGEDMDQAEARHLVGQLAPWSPDCDPTSTRKKRRAPPVGPTRATPLRTPCRAARTRSTTGVATGTPRSQRRLQGPLRKGTLPATGTGHSQKKRRK